MERKLERRKSENAPFDDEKGGYYLGFDISTQQIKAVVTTLDLKFHHESVVEFDKDLPHYKTVGGVHTYPDGVTVTSPVEMWLEAMDILLKGLVADKVDLSQIRALSGAGQQHGSVYWKRGAREILRKLDSDETLLKQLKGAFSRSNCPIWMDASTKKECNTLEETVGGPLKLAEITGSKAFERFTGNQIKKIFDNEPEVYANTERISLVSSFGASLFLGDYAHIDWSDGSGMNLLDVTSHEWNEQCLTVCGGERLKALLGSPVPSNTILGCISNYFVERYGFDPDCRIITFTGDNPATMAGINQNRGDVAVSLGTSDTVFVWMESPVASLNIHVLCNPIESDKYMGMLCFKNGAMTRNRIREKCKCKDWNDFNKLLSKTQPGNKGNIGFYFDFPEILPAIPANDYRFDKTSNKVKQFPDEVEARAVIEHQCLAKRVHAEEMGYIKGGRILVTGGASTNEIILKTLANVFDSPVYVQNIQNSAALGSAFRAKHGLFQKPFAEICDERSAIQFQLAAEPDPKFVQVYHDMTEKYRKLEALILKNS